MIGVPCALLYGVARCIGGSVDGLGGSVSCLGSMLGVIQAWLADIIGIIGTIC